MQQPPGDIGNKHEEDIPGRQLPSQNSVLGKVFLGPLYHNISRRELRIFPFLLLEFPILVNGIITHAVAIVET